MNINPYLNFNGNCAEAFKFYAQALGGKIEGLMTFGQLPAEYPVSPETRDLVMHLTLVAEGQTLMGSDAPPGRYEKPQGLSVSLNISDLDRATRVFNALAEGGNVTMPFQKTFWARGFGMATDRFGIPWMVNCQ